MSGRRPGIGAVAGALVVAPLVILPGSPAAATPVVHRVSAEVSWILSARLPDGAIAQFPDRSRIDPYLGNYAALGLAEASRHDGSRAQSAAAWDWLAWYQRHMDPLGYVTDYLVGPAPSFRETSTGDQDSTDAYAGTFLVALWEAYSASGDLVRLRSFAAGLRGAVSAIRSTQQPDGLTWATPSYHASLLMDQAEAYTGLRSAGRLGTALGLHRLAAEANDMAQRMRQGVADLWRPGSPGIYDRAEVEGGSHEPSSWGIFYPDAVSQVWLVAVGNGLSPGQPLVPARRARALVDTFAHAWPRWASPSSPATFDAGSRAVGYWPMLARAYEVTGRDGVAREAVASIRMAATRANRAWPYSVASAGQLEAARL
jgi:hypothetical protein